MRINAVSVIRERLIDLRVIHKRISLDVYSQTLLIALIPMFLIITSSIYPAIMSSVENREMSTIAEALAQPRQDNNVDTSSHHSDLLLAGSPNITPNSPTSMDRTASASPSFSPRIQYEENDNLITPTSINAGDLVHVLWTEAVGPSNNDILYKRDGADFDPTTINLSNTPGNSLGAILAVSGNNVHVVWTETDEITAFSEVLYRRSTDGGATFGPTIDISMNPDTQSFASGIAVAENNVHIVWHDNMPGVFFDIFYRRSTNGGASFTEPSKNISSNDGNSVSAKIAASGATVHVVWKDNTPGNDDTFYRRSTNNGAAFHPIKNLSSNAGGSIHGPSIGVSGNSVHVVWEDNTPGNFDILYRRSLDGGSSFPNVIKNLSGNPGTSQNPAITVSGNNVHVVWENGAAPAGNRDIFHRRSLDGGTTFPNIIKNVSNNVGPSLDPDIAISGNNVYIVWQDDTSAGFGEEILYNSSSDNGASFPATLTNLSASEGDSSFFAAIAVSHG